MNKTERIDLIKQIESNRNSRVIVYITGDRRSLETRISPDIFPIFNKCLEKIGSTEKIDLFIYSTGGLIISGYALVNTITEFCTQKPMPPVVCVQTRLHNLQYHHFQIDP